jgi:hypothetical protein
MASFEFVWISENGMLPRKKSLSFTFYGESTGHGGRA